MRPASASSLTDHACRPARWQSAWFRAEQVCATPKAVLGFHAAWQPTPFGGRAVSVPATQHMMNIYPADLQGWINGHGGLTPHMIFLKGPGAFGHGVRLLRSRHRGGPHHADRASAAEPPGPHDHCKGSSFSPHLCCPSSDTDVLTGWNAVDRWVDRINLPAKHLPRCSGTLAVTRNDPEQGAVGGKAAAVGRCSAGFPLPTPRQRG